MCRDVRKKHVTDKGNTGGQAPSPPAGRAPAHVSKHDHSNCGVASQRALRPLRIPRADASIVWVLSFFEYTQSANRYTTKT